MSDGPVTGEDFEGLADLGSQNACSATCRGFQGGSRVDQRGNGRGVVALHIFPL